MTPAQRRRMHRDGARKVLEAARKLIPDRKLVKRPETVDELIKDAEAAVARFQEDSNDVLPD